MYTCGFLCIHLNTIVFFCFFGFVPSALDGLFALCTNFIVAFLVSINEHAYLCRGEAQHSIFRFYALERVVHHGSDYFRLPVFGEAAYRFPPVLVKNYAVSFHVYLNKVPPSGLTAHYSKRRESFRIPTLVRNLCLYFYGSLSVSVIAVVYLRRGACIPGRACALSSLRG